MNTFKFISSICVILSPKDSSSGFVSVVLNLDHISGCTIPQAINYALKNPNVKCYFSKYVISSFSFKYFGL